MLEGEYGAIRGDCVEGDLVTRINRMGLQRSTSLTDLSQRHREARSRSHVPSNSRVSIQTESIMFQPTPIGHPVIRCRITRRRPTSGSPYPEYELFLEGASDSRFFLFSARRRTNARGSIYKISMNRIDSGQFDERIVAKVKSNFLGTLFSIYDSKAGWRRERNEQAAVLYQPNLLGLRGPRKFLLLLPGLTEDDKIKPLTYKAGECRLHNQFTDDQGIRNIVVLRNKEPLWNDGKRSGCMFICDQDGKFGVDSQSYVLNFSDRVSQASVKNFQVVHHLDRTKRLFHTISSTFPRHSRLYRAAVWEGWP